MNSGLRAAARALTAHAPTLASGPQPHVTNGQERHSLLIIVRALRTEIEYPRRSSLAAQECLMGEASLKICITVIPIRLVHCLNGLQLL